MYLFIKKLVVYIKNMNLQKPDIGGEGGIRTHGKQKALSRFRVGPVTTTSVPLREELSIVDSWCKC